MSETVYEALFILVLILVNGLFAMAEIGLVSVRKARLQSRAEDGDRAAQAALRLAENPTRLLSTAQIGITLVGILSGAVGGATLSHLLAQVLAQVSFLAPYSEPLGLVIVVVVITYLTIVLGELAPKRLALVDPERVALSSARWMEFLGRLASPIVHVLSGSTNLVLRMAGSQAGPAPDATEEEVKILLEQGTQSGVFAEAEQDMVEGVFRLGDRSVAMIMTPRTEIVWLDLSDPYEEIVKQALAAEYSSYPVAQGTLDEVVGILRVRELLRVEAARREEGARPPADLRPLLHSPIFLPENTPALKALEQFKQGGLHMALVMDEYGGVLGLVTLFDILESIVGEIHAGVGEVSEPQVIRRPDGSLLLDGLLKVDELKEVLDLKELPDEDRVGYQTLGGLVMSQMGAIPRSGQFFDWNGLRFEVVDMDERRVDKVLVRTLDE